MLGEAPMLAVAPFFRVDIASLLTALATIVTAGAAVGALVYASKQISAAQQRAKEELAYELYARDEDPAFVKPTATAVDFLTIDERKACKRRRLEKRRWRRWRRMNREEQGTIVLYLNHFENVGGLYALDRLDEKATMLLFGLTAHTYWGRFEWFIRRLRRRAPRAYSEWEKFKDAYQEYIAEQKPSDGVSGVG